MVNEIDNYILKEGIEIYLHYEMTIDFTKKEKQNLINSKLEEIENFYFLMKI